MRLAESIARFESHRRKAYDLKEQDISDYLVFTALAMECFQAVNSLIEIGQSLITIRRMPLPDTYRKVFDMLCRQGVISFEAAEAGKRLVYLRNLIAHEYHMISEQELLEAVDLFSKVEEVLTVAKREVTHQDG
ncbi:MAG: hypothetical protein KatS3mg023_1716 [Armatimonadota bacterium]|nr:MAG: hypothetical protein KatS3mg023_1716 [Armatimonadota bacterium]